MNTLFKFDGYMQPVKYEQCQNIATYIFQQKDDHAIIGRLSWFDGSGWVSTLNSIDSPIMKINCSSLKSLEKVTKGTVDNCLLSFLY